MFRGSIIHPSLLIIFLSHILIVENMEDPFAESFNGFAQSMTRMNRWPQAGYRSKIYVG